MDSPLLEIGAAEMARQIAKGEISPVELVEAHIERIKGVNPMINAVVTPLFESAREQAKEREGQLSHMIGELPPLFGVPITVKDSLAVEGVRFTAGTRHLSNYVADKDAEAVRRMRSAGAIILGKTNLSDMCVSVETCNPVFGRTNNPWQVAHSAGGSSGGDAAIVTVGGSALGLGSDIAGSVRMPAAFCGVFSLKPTAGRIPTEGHLPQPPEAIDGWSTVGPMARTVEDLALALSVLSKTDVRDYRDIDLSGRQVIVPNTIRVKWVSAAVRNGVKQAAEALGEAGMNVRRGVPLRMTRVSFAALAQMQEHWLPSVRRDLRWDGEPISILEERREARIGVARVSGNALANLRSVNNLGPPLRALGFANPDRLDGYRKRILDKMGDGGVLLWPVYESTAPKHGFAAGMRGLPAYTAVFNALGFPAAAVPLDFADDGLPLAVQVAGAPGDDEVVLAVAAALEEAFGG